MKMNTVPAHVSIIMDGNGRWAQKHILESRLMGHKAGIDSVTEITEVAVSEGVKHLSVFAFSDENWNRPQEEIDGLMGLFMDSILSKRELFFKNSVRFRVIGDLSKISKELRSAIDDLEKATAKFDVMSLAIMLSYSGRWDIMQAMQKYCVGEGYDGSSLPDPDKFEKYLATYGMPDPDLLIRTSGEQRISNYMLWQMSYTEFYFTDVLWPDFRKEEFLTALDAFSNRERRYGKTGSQIQEQKKVAL